MKQDVIAITGSTGGIGRATAEAFVRQGARVRLHSGGNPESRAATLAALTAIRPDAVVDVAVANLTDAASAEHLTAVWSEGPLTGLVCSAGPFRRAAWDDLGDSDLERLFRGNLFSTWTLLQRLMPRLRAQGGGTITLLGQNRIQDLASAPGWTAYNAAKAGLVILVRTLSETEGPHGIRINLVNPGLIDSGNYSGAFVERAEEKIPARRMGLPEDVADVVVWLHSQAAHYMNGAILDCNGGLQDTSDSVSAQCPSWDWSSRASD